MYRNIVIAAGSTYTVKIGHKLCVESMILFPATPGTSMTVTIVSDNMPPSIVVATALQLEGPFIFRSDKVGGATIAPATGHLLLVGAEEQHQS